LGLQASLFDFFLLQSPFGYITVFPFFAVLRFPIPSVSMISEVGDAASKDDLYPIDLSGAFRVFCPFAEAFFS